VEIVESENYAILLSTSDISYSSYTIIQQTPASKECNFIIMPYYYTS
jgi:hypothetical protein